VAARANRKNWTCFFEAVLIRGFCFKPEVRKMENLRKFPPLSGHGPAAGLRFELKMEVTCQHGGFFLLRLIWNIVGISPSGK
jgi:hypothetical protein